MYKCETQQKPKSEDIQTQNQKIHRTGIPSHTKEQIKQFYMSDPDSVRVHYSSDITHSFNEPVKHSVNCADVLQCAEWRTNSLQHEASDEVKKPTFRLGNDYKIHHTLSREAISIFIAYLYRWQETKIRILELFARAEDQVVETAPGRFEITERGKKEIASLGTGEDSPLLDKKIPNILYSLRSNLTLGPSNRTHDPKSGLDPNTDSSGHMDRYSQIYAHIFDLINSLKDVDQKEKIADEAYQDFLSTENPYAEREEAAEFYRKLHLLKPAKTVFGIVNEIIDCLFRAEELLAETQGAASVKGTMLRPFNPENWIPSDHAKKKDGASLYRKQGQTDDGKPVTPK